MCKSKQIWLEEEGDIVDGEHDDITDVDGTTTVKIKCVEYVRLEFNSDSLEAIELKKKLNEIQRGKRILIYKTDDPKRPLIVAEKKADHNNES